MGLVLSGKPSVDLSLTTAYLRQADPFVKMKHRSLVAHPDSIGRYVLPVMPVK